MEHEPNTYTARQVLYLFSKWGVYSPLPGKECPIIVNTPYEGRFRVSNVTLGRASKRYLVEPA